MSDYAGKYTVEKSGMLHRGDPQPHDILSHEAPKGQPDYAGGRTAKASWTWPGFPSSPKQKRKCLLTKPRKETN